MNQRQVNTTNYPIPFLMVNALDHQTGMTGLTPAVTLSKNGGAFATPSGAVTEIGNGWYALAGNATDRNTLGDLIIHATSTGADPWDGRFTIVPWDPYNGASMGLTNLDTTISSRSTLTSQGVWEHAGRTLTGFGTLTSDIAMAVWGAAGRTLSAFGFTVATNKDSAIDAIKAKTDNLPATPAAVGSAMTLTSEERAAIRYGLATEVNATTNKFEVLAGISGTGTGPYAVLITVTDGTNQLHGAKVRLVEGVNSFEGLTNAAGHIAFSLDAATYSVTISKAGYSFTPTTLVVSGGMSQSYAMAAVTVNPSADPDVCVCYGTVFDVDGNIATGMSVSFTMSEIPNGIGLYKAGTKTVTSECDGSVTANLIRGAKYKMKMSGKDAIEITVPGAATYELPRY